MEMTPQMIATILGTGVGSLLSYHKQNKDEDMKFLDEEQKQKELLLAMIKGGLMGGGVGFTSGFFMNNK